MVPQFVFASWWNPFSWNSSEKATEVTTPQTPALIPEEKEVSVNKNDNLVVVKKVNKQSKASTTTNSINTKNTDLKKSADLNDVSKQQKLELLYISNSKILENQPGYDIKQNFLSNPTINNLRNFCDLAKSVEGKTTKKILSENKQEMIEVKRKLVEEIFSCNIINDDKYEIIPLDNKLLISIQNEDTDSVREAKILYNDKIKNFINTNKVKLIGFRKETITQNKSTKIFASPVDYFQFEIDYNKELISKYSNSQNYSKYIQSSNYKLKNISNLILDLNKDFK